MVFVVTAVVGPLVVNAPLAAALVVGFVLTMKRRALDRRGARLVAVGLVLAFCSLPLSGGLQVLTGALNTHLLHLGNGGAVQATYTVVDVIASLLTGAGWILAAVALVRREPRS